MSEGNIRDVRFLSGHFLSPLIVVFLTNWPQVINFAHRHRLVLLVDEVYQVNCYEPSLPFVSFRKVLSTMPKEIAANQELFSFHSVSKGVIGEVFSVLMC